MPTITARELKILLNKAGISTEGKTATEIRAEFDAMITQDEVYNNRRVVRRLFNSKLENGDFDSIENPTSIVIT